VVDIDLSVLVRAAGDQVVGVGPIWILNCAVGRGGVAAVVVFESDVAMAGSV